MPPLATDRAAIALAAFRQRVKQHEMNGQSKPDMVAFKELSRYYTPERTHGMIAGIPIGIHFRGRGEAAILGVHQQMMKGIDGLKGQSCYAVCISGGYIDDEDNYGSDGTIVYTGDGGQNKKGRQVEDQQETAGNLSLMRSHDTQLPIRVLRKMRNGHYVFVGLFLCSKYSYEPGLDGPKVYRFTLKPIQTRRFNRNVSPRRVDALVGPGRDRAINNATHKKRRTSSAGLLSRHRDDPPSKRVRFNERDRQTSSSSNVRIPRKRTQLSLIFDKTSSIADGKTERPHLPSVPIIKKKYGRRESGGVLKRLLKKMS